jgi:hypothetical protein
MELDHAHRAGAPATQRRWPEQCAIARMTRRTTLCDTTRRMTMKNPLDSIWGTIISGLVLTAILYLAAKNILM